MQTQLSKDHEEKRVQALFRYEIMDTPSEKELDDITRLASIMCDVPICLISLLDDTRQWFKSNLGLEAKETAKSISFCVFAIQQNVLFEVQNSLLDKRFDKNPLVLNFPFIRFYAGMPLQTPSGYNIGTLCVIDIKPRVLDSKNRYLLQILANQVITNFELRKNNKELKLLSEEASKLAKTKDTFLNNMSHELRTPLNAIYGFTQLMNKTKLDVVQKEYVSTIKSSVEMLVSIIDDILDYSKLGNGKLKIEKSSFNIRELIKGIYEILKLAAEEKNISLKINMERAIPSYLCGDKVRLNQILMNLLGNALKFTNKGSVVLNIRKLQETAEEFLMSFTIRDTGIGIPSQKLKEIFDRFEQSHGANSVYGGTGLGLSITKSLIELQDGKINVQSIYGKGSEFSFTMKYSKMTEQEITTIIAQEKKQSANTKQPYLNNLRILLVEDVDVNIRLIQKVVEGTGIQLDTAKNGRICLDKLKEKEYDVILMDLQMPEMNGFEATSYIRNTLHMKIPVIAVSANICEIDRDKCLSIGMNDYLTKPFKIDQLLIAISKCINMNKYLFEEDGEKNLLVDTIVPKFEKKLTTLICNNSPDSFHHIKHSHSDFIKFDFSREIPKAFKISKKTSNSNNSYSGNEVLLPMILKSQMIVEVMESININSLKEFSGDDEELEKEIMEKFLEEMPVYLKELEIEIAKENFISIKEAAHKMKAPVAMFGLDGLRNKLKEIEDFAQNSLGDSILKKFSACKIQLQKNFNQLELLLSQYN